MSSQFYMRVRGRVLGPYDQDKLQSLARRGQLSRMHEISPDGVSWERASKFPDLFVHGASDPSAELPASPVASPHMTAQAGPAPQAGGRQQWHYALNGTEHGPIEYSQLQLLAGTGQIGPDDQVWSEGMPAWVLARQVSGLFKASQPSIGGKPSDEPDQLPAGLCRAATGSRPWALFMAVLSLAIGIGLAVWGVFLLVLGGNERGPIIIAVGVSFLVSAILAEIAGWLLLTFCGRLAGLTYTKSPLALSRALDALRVFWTFVGIVAIVIIALAAFLCVWIFAFAGALP